MVLEKYGSKCGDDNYDRVVDVTKDGKIDLYDSIKVNSYCGSDGEWCMNRLNDHNDPCITTTSTSTTTQPQLDTTSTTSTTTTIPCRPESCNNLYTMVLEKYGSKCSNPNYDPVADVNKDGKIDLYDSAAVSSHCGNGVWCQERLSDTYDPCPYTTTTSTTSTTTTTIPCPPQVCQSLLDRVRRNYGKKCGNIDYDPVADINKDKKVDLFDATSVLNKCGSDGEWCEARVNDTSNPCASVQQLINNCMDKCSKRYPAFWCRFTCSVSCNFGFC